MLAKITFGSDWATFTPGKTPEWDSSDSIWADILNDLFPYPGPDIAAPLETTVKKAANYFGAKVEEIQAMPVINDPERVN